MHKITSRAAAIAAAVAVSASAGITAANASTTPGPRPGYAYQDTSSRIRVHYVKKRGLTRLTSTCRLGPCADGYHWSSVSAAMSGATPKIKSNPAIRAQAAKHPGGVDVKATVAQDVVGGIEVGVGVAVVVTVTAVGLGWSWASNNVTDPLDGPMLGKWKVK